MILFSVVTVGLEPGLAALRLLGQVRNTRPASLPLALLIYSPRFRLASSATGSASAPRPIDVSHLLDTDERPGRTRHKKKPPMKGGFSYVVCTGLEPVTPSM